MGSQVLALGFIGGVIFYAIKLASFQIVTIPQWLRWLRRLAHSTPIGLFILDIVMGYYVSSVIHSIAGEGLVVLFFFVGFSVSSIIYIVGCLGYRKAKEASCNFGRSLYQWH